MAAYLAFHRDGGENHFPVGRLAKAIHQALTTGDPAHAASLLQQFAADPDFANQLSFLSPLHAITAGSHDPSLVQDPGLDFAEAAEVVLLIEALEGGPSS